MKASTAGGDAVRISADKVRKAHAIGDSCRARRITFYYGLCLYFA